MKYETAFSKAPQVVCNMTEVGDIGSVLVGTEGDISPTYTVCRTTIRTSTLHQELYMA